jgi:hypothetical protein
MAFRKLAAIAVAVTLGAGVAAAATPAAAAAAAAAARDRGAAVAPLAGKGLPGAPQQVTAAGQDSGALVSWMPPSSTGGSPITGYVITASPGGATVDTAAVTSYLVGGLTDGTAYQFTVAAVNKSGTGPASSLSTAITPLAPTVPGPARSVEVIGGFEQASVSWAAPKSDGGAPVSGYRLTTNPATTAMSVSGATRSATMTGLADGTTYRVQVAAQNSVGTGMSARSSQVTPQVTVPGAPAEVAAAPAKSGVVVSWQPPASDGGSAVTGYVIAVVGTSQTATAGPTATSVTIKGLTSGTSYTFDVAAVNATGQGTQASSAPATAGGTVTSATVVLSAQSLAALTEVQTDGTLVFTSPPAQVSNLAAADIVVAGVSTETPAGLLAKVTAVTSSGPTVTVSTVAASLDEVFSAAGFGTSSALNSDQVARFTPARPGVRLLPAGKVSRSGRRPGSIALNLDTTLYQSSNGQSVSVKGSVSLTPSMSFSTAITGGSTTTSQFNGSITASAALSISAQLSHDITGGYHLGEVTFDPITVTVLGVPVVIVPTATLQLIAQGTVTTGTAASAGQDLTISAQVATSGATVTAQPKYTYSVTSTPPTLYGGVAADADAGAGADLSVTVDGVPGPELTDSVWLAELAANPASSPWWTLSSENVLGLDYPLSLLDQSLATYKKTLSDVTLPLAEAPDPYQGITITPDPATVAPGGTVQLAAQVAGVTGQKVTWSVPAGDGTVTGGGRYTAPATAGTYQVTAVQPASGLNPGATGLISIQVGDQPPGPPANPTATSTRYGDATIKWTAPDNGGGTISGYTITAGTDGGLTYPVSGTRTSYTITGLPAGESFTFAITATSDGGTSLSSPPTSPIVIDDAGGG